MKSESTPDRPSRRASLSWALASLASVALALAWTPAATAKPGHLPRAAAAPTEAGAPQPTPPPPEPAASPAVQPAPSGNPAPAPASPQAAPEAPPPPQEVQPPHQPGGGAAGGPPNGHQEGAGPAPSQAPSGTSATLTQPEHANREAARERKAQQDEAKTKEDEGKAKEEEGKTKETEANEEKPSKASQRVEEKLAHAKEKTAAAQAKAEGEKEAAEGKVKAAVIEAKEGFRPAAAETGGKGAGGSSSSGAGSSGPGSAVPAPAPAPAATPPVPTPVPVNALEAPPTVRGSFSQTTGRAAAPGTARPTGAAGGAGTVGRGTAGGGAGGGGTGGGGTGGGEFLTPPLAAAGASVPATHPTGSHHGQAAGSDHGVSQLATTITKIVDVVPTAIRILIGALVALGLALAASSRLIALRARRLARQRRELLEDVGLLQGALLPTLPARLGPVATSAAYRPAAGPAAGGDFYDVFALEDGQLGVIVGDMSGHGRQALPHTALVRFTLRAYLEAGMAPRNALQRAAAVLERQLTGSFATVVAATYHPRDRVLTYATAGHPPPVVVGAQSVTPITVASAPPIGAGLPTGMRQTVVSLPGWALACFYTDGVIEAKVGPEELFGPARLEQALAELAPGATATALLDRVAAGSNEHSDDMAACLLRIDGGAGQPSVQVEELELDSREAAGDRAERFLLACGVSAGEIPAIMRSARATAARTGNVVLKLRLGEGPPQVSMRNDNVTFLDSAARQHLGSS